MPKLMEMPIDPLTVGDAVQRVFKGVARGTGGTVLTLNIDILRQYRSSPVLRSVFEHTSVLVADGMPLVVASRLQGTPLPSRVTGTDLLWAITSEAALPGVSIYMAGGRPGDAQRAAEELRRHFPELDVTTRPCLVRPESEAQEVAALSRTLVASAPDVVFLGLPFHAEVAVITALREKLPSTWFVGVGSTFELVSGERTRPPAFLRRLCLEWAWRLTRQPELWHRYLIEDMPIVARLGVDALRVRLHHHRDYSAPLPGQSYTDKDLLL